MDFFFKTVAYSLPVWMPSSLILGTLISQRSCPVATRQKGAKMNDGPWTTAWESHSCENSGVLYSLMPTNVSLSKALKSCFEVDCGHPPLIPNSEMKWDMTSRLGSIVEYKCNKGFYATSPKTLFHCTPSGSWEILDLRCKSKYMMTSSFKTSLKPLFFFLHLLYGIDSFSFFYKQVWIFSEAGCWNQLWKFV